MTPDELQARLRTAYPDADIEVVDLTGTEDHYQVMIASSMFEGLNRIERQRHVMNVFDAELKSGEVHALTIKALPKNS